MEEALRGDTVIWGQDNVQKRYLITKGAADQVQGEARHAQSAKDIEAALAACEVVVEGRYTTGHQEQMYIEPQGVVAWWSEDARIDIDRGVRHVRCTRPLARRVRSRRATRRGERGAGTAGADADALNLRPAGRSASRPCRYHRAPWLLISTPKPIASLRYAMRRPVH